MSCLLLLLAAATPCRGSNWYVSTNGSGNGSLSSPWSLQTAITSSSVKAGDSVWLLGGTYFPTTTYPDLDVNRLGWMPTISGNSGGLITFASYSNQWAAIDRVWMLKSANYLCFSNLEFYDSLKGRNLTNISNPNVPWNQFPMGSQTGFQWVNCVIHDVDDCFSSGAAATSIRGNILWYVGWYGLEHVCYPAPAVFSGNICAWHIQDVINFNTQNMICTSNIIFGGGQTENDALDANSDIVGGGYNETIAWNYFYNRLPSSSTITAECLNLQSSPAGIMTIASNVIVAPLPITFAGGSNAYGTVSMQYNTVYASASGYGASTVSWDATNGTWAMDENNYYSTSPNPVAFTIQGSYGNSLSQWQSEEGFDAHAAAKNGTPPPYAVYVIPNQDVPKRAHIAVYNWPKSNTVSVSLSGILNAGDFYQLISAQNYKAGPIQAGTYNGASISIPMTGLTTAPILYGTNMSPDGVPIVQPPPTSPEFGAFVVIGTSAPGSTTVPPPPTGFHIMPQK